MKHYFQNLHSSENRRMHLFLLAYLFSGLVGLAIGKVFSSMSGVIIAVSVTFLLARKLTKTIYTKVKVTCPLCNGEELKENFTLQCKSAEYECKQCHSLYVEGVLIEK